MKARRTKGIVSPPATLRCQRKNKRHVKHCAEWQEREYYRQAMETVLVNTSKIIRKSEDLPRFGG